MDPNTAIDPQQIQQILVTLQEISAKLDHLQSASPEMLNHAVDNVFDNLLSYHLLTR